MLCRRDDVRQTALDLTNAAQENNASTDSEREQQQEKEQEQEKEKEKEREREREGEYTRDDEQHNPWFAEAPLANADAATLAIRFAWDFHDCRDCKNDSAALG